jgi:hypothetical protein
LLPWHDKVGLLFSFWMTSTHDDLWRFRLI